MENKTTVNNITTVSENVTGKKLVKLSELTKAKIETNKAVKDEKTKLTFNLNMIKNHGANYVKELNAKHNTKVTLNDITSLSAKQLAEVMTEKQQEQSYKNGFSTWFVLNLIVKFYSKK